jgi:hypothetical protein
MVYLVINSTNKNIKAVLDVMNKINVIQQEAEQHRSKVQDRNFKEHLRYFKSRDKKVHKMSKSLVTMLSNLSIVMCHAFVKDQTLLPQMNLPNFPKDSKEQLPKAHNLHVFNNEEEDNVVAKWT